MSNSFYDVWQQLSWDDVTLKLYSSNADDVERALNKNRLNNDDFMALLSPAAERYLPALAERSQRLTRQRFGNTLQLFIPLYLSNLCANDCSYCGFSMSNRLKRKTLSVTEIEQECRAIKAKGFDTILIVTGEHETKVGIEYFRQAMPIIKRYFSYVMFEVQPLSSHEYNQLRQHGLDAVMVYQETYSSLTYSQHHLKGKKRDFRWRLETPDRLGACGMDKIGLGSLIGLEDWRIDSTFTAIHLDYMRKRYWRSRYSLSFPRLRPCTGGVSDVKDMTNKQLVQLICAYRLRFPDVELSLSTREEQSLRDGLFSLGVTSVSAESKTQPGGYANENGELEQFSIDDERSVNEVANAIKAKGLQPVWTDWLNELSATPSETFSSPE
ncbi:2-iminoacetate synthase ThiH [Idiomarina sp.]|uniref:2-iminoacetate synthase ThiH n=1 Tax=Idiomarina sp. TaxID=1874361 RepID=UPI001D31460B|nr:2-iminoacetate synthase ThiH [Idiomarina sp.]MCJ8315558.1 2-iminoacetate synthase ThiH [Idiomarina sp.]NQZ15473.1 2-iminoacetate synthase ThiH [Idiomarina sp.]